MQQLDLSWFVKIGSEFCHLMCSMLSYLLVEEEKKQFLDDQDPDENKGVPTVPYLTIAIVQSQDRILDTSRLGGH